MNHLHLRVKHLGYLGINILTAAAIQIVHMKPAISNPLFHIDWLLLGYYAT